MALVKINPAKLIDLANSRQPASTEKKNSSEQKRKGHATSCKEVLISFSQKPKGTTKASNNEINSVS